MIRYKIRVDEEKYTCFEMTNFKKHESGFPYDIWLYSAGYTRNTPLRIKVGFDGDLIPIMMTSQKEISAVKPFQRLNAIIVWASENYETLFKHWVGELSDRQALNLLAKDS